MWVLSCFVYFLCLRMETFSKFRHCEWSFPYPRNRIPITSLSHTSLLLDLPGLFIHSTILRLRQIKGRGLPPV